MSSTQLDKSTIDYSVYLVTDSALNRSSRTVAQTVEAAILGGVRIVQVREKQLGDDEFTRLAKEVQAVTKKYNVPFIINDRIDVAVAIDADGVHVGQKDTPASVARERIGPHKILGVSVETVEHACQAFADGADYIGIQTCFPTATKTTPAIVQGHIGVRSILEEIPVGVNMKTVAIGGLNAGNVGRIVTKSLGQNGSGLHGVAVVSAIVGAEDAKQASVELLQIFKQAKADRDTSIDNLNQTIAEAFNFKPKTIPQLLTELRQQTPLVFHITNYVSMNDCANATLAIGGSPIMAFAPEEVEDLVKVAGALVINTGTLTEDLIELALAAGKHANALGKPVVLDPVGAGATDFRRRAVRRILNAVHVDVIKGNASEIAAVAEITGFRLGSGMGQGEVQARGVDSVGAGFKNPEEIVRGLATRERCVIVMSGKTDYVSDRHQVLRIENGHPLQGRITGSGCMLASVIASFSAAAELKDDFAIFAAAFAGVVCTNLAGEHAASRPDVQGPGTFRAAFIDEMANLKPEDESRFLNEIRDKIVPQTANEYY